MEERSSHLTLVVGASSIAEDLRQSMAQHGMAHAGVAGHLRGLRRSMVLGDGDLVIVCIAMDRSTIQRHGEALRQLLNDCHCFPQAVRSVGLLTQVGLTRDAAQMGCDVYVHDSRQAEKAVRLLARRWQSQQTVAHDRPGGDSASRLNWDRLDSWTWCTARIPQEFAPLLADREAASRRDASANAQDKRRRRRGSDCRNQGGAEPPPNPREISRDFD